MPAGDSATNLADLFKKSMEANYITSEEKQSLISENVHFPVKRIQPKIGGQYGPEWEVTIEYGGEDRPLTLQAGSRGRDTWLENLADFVKRKGPQSCRMVERKAKSGRDYFIIVPAEMADEDIPSA